MRHKRTTISDSRTDLPRRAFTVMELLLVLLIMSIVSVICLDSISGFEANQRADRAAREALTCFRYARTLAMTTGKDAKVTVDTNARTLSVYWKSNGTAWDATPVATGMTSSGTWILNMNNNRELVGTAISLAPVANTTFTYGALGNCTMATSSTTVTFTYAGRTKTLVVGNVGDPVLQ